MVLMMFGVEGGFKSCARLQIFGRHLRYISGTKRRLRNKCTFFSGGRVLDKGRHSFGAEVRDSRRGFGWALAVMDRIGLDWIESG